MQSSDLLAKDQAARVQALDASQSFIVQAPAGSGKTELLIQRFLSLLKIVKSPEEILAMTFTKKAANEMRVRVINALKSAHDPEPETAHAKLTWRIAKDVLQRDAQFNWNIIHNPNRLRIQTIDSLCSYLTKQLPLLSHFGSQPDISQQPDILYREAVKEVLLHVEENFEWSAAISHLLLHLDNDFNKLHNLLVNLLEKRDQWLPYIALDTQDADIKIKLEQQLEAVICDSLKKLIDIFPRTITLELLALARYAASNLLANQRQSIISLCDGLTDLPGSNAYDKNKWVALSSLLLTDEGTWRKSFDNRVGFPAPSTSKNPAEKATFASYKERMKVLLASLQDNDALRLMLAELSTLPDPHYTDQQWEILQSLLVVLKIIAAQLRLTFQQYGQIDFIENAQAAILALGSDDHPTDLALALDYQIRHLLVDEFQDTSFTQYQLIEKLTAGWEMHDGRTLFVVGDPMQSIYRFRQAEVGLFIRMRKNGIGNIQLIPLTLTVNFRSLAPIVEWNNQHFSHIFPKFNDIATGAVHYSPSITLKHDSQDADINIVGLVNSDEQTQAKHVIDCIQKTRQLYPADKIAILVRSRANLSAIIPELTKAKIPYKAIEIDPLASRQHIQDLLSLTCALLHPADRIAWLAILRAPWCGLTLSDLLILGSDSKSILWERMNQPEILTQLSDDGRMRLQRITPILKAKLAERERYDLRSWIEGTWLLLGGPACLSVVTYLEDANQYFKLLTEFSQNSRLLNVERLKERMTSLFAASQNDDGAVQIMTIHAAKGLEFDTVILPHLERKMSGNDKSILQWMDRPLSHNQNALLLAPIHATGNDTDSIYEYINLQERVKGNYEIDRLLYVATTRAKKRLYLFYNVKDDNGIKVDGSSFLAKLMPLIAMPKAIETPDEPLTVITRPARRIKRLATQWQNPITTIKSVNVAYHDKQTGFRLNDERPRLIGVTLHAIFQQLGIQGLDWWLQKNPHAQINYLEFHLRQFGLTPEHIPAARQTALAAIQNTLSDERGRWILQPHAEHQCELALSAIIEGKLENLVIDRTFVEENIRWIVDYKTTTFTHHDLDVFLENEQEKYLKKMQLYARAIQAIDERKICLGLYFPALRAWRQWQF